MKLGVNIDHVATLRQARLAKEPDLVRAAVLAEKAGADGITIHLREDRRHIQDRDVRVLRQVITSRLNLEMATSDDIVEIALEVLPEMVTLVPEKREELTTEGGLNIADKSIRLKTEEVIKKLKGAGIEVSLFLDSNPEIMELAKDMGADYIEIHTGSYADAETEEEVEKEFLAIKATMEAAIKAGLKVNAGHGLDYKNTTRIAQLNGIEELNIGHSIVAKSIFNGIEEAVKEMKDIIKNA